jgi:hypothetical protein
LGICRAGLLQINPQHPRVGEFERSVTRLASTGVTWSVDPDGRRVRSDSGIQASRSDLNVTLKEAGYVPEAVCAKTSSIDPCCERSGARTRPVNGAALLIRTFSVLRGVTGFDIHNILTMEMSLGDRVSKKRRALTNWCLSTAASREFARRRGYRGNVLLAASGGWAALRHRRAAADRRNRSWRGPWKPVSPRYFDVFKIPLVRGRMFTDRDDAGAPGVVLISEGLAGSSGQRRPVDNASPSAKASARIRGAATRNYRHRRRHARTGLDNKPNPSMYVPVHN